MGRKTEKFLVLDIETANSLEDNLAYDIGFLVGDRQKTIYEEYSYTVYDVYAREKELMQSAYYCEKLPLYEKDLKENKSKLAQLTTIRKKIFELCKKYDIKKIYMYNASFDYRGCNKTLRYITKSKMRWFFPYGVEICCIWHIACQTVCNRMNYAKFCLDNEFYSQAENMQTSAEVVYRFLTNQVEFEEEHRGLDDVKIEFEILCKCLEYHEKINHSINRGCYHIPQKKFKKVLNKHRILWS